MIQGSTILVTGGSGSLGKKLCLELSKHNRVIVYSRNEERQFFMQQQVNSKNIRYIVGDIRDFYSLKRAMCGCDMAIHAAAMKDLVICEKQPTQAYLNNIQGSRYFIEAALDLGIKKAIGISTDKAAAPSSVYGMTKYIMEKMFIEAGLFCVRFGNMINSEGSIIHYWRDRPNLKIKLTHPKMTRFFFRISDAVKAVIYTLEHAKSGEIFVPIMKKATILDILKIITGRNKFEIMGIFPGEKIQEDLIADYESFHKKENYFIIRKNGNLFGFSTKQAESFSTKELKSIIWL